MSEEEIDDFCEYKLYHEETEFVDKKVSEYLNNLSGFEMIFISKKQLNKNINYITKQAHYLYRGTMMRRIKDILVKEEQRIDDLIEEINDKVSEYCDSQKLMMSDRKPFKLVTAFEREGFTPQEVLKRVINVKDFKIAWLETTDLGDK